MFIKKRVLLLSAVSLGALLLAGCGTNSTIATSTMVLPQLLLPSQFAQNKTVYVQVNNVTGQSLNLLQPLDQALQSNGYTVVADMQNANQVVTVDVLQVGKNTMTNVNTAAAAGVGGTVATPQVGRALLIPGNDLRVMVTNAATQNLTYSIIADVKFSYKVSSNNFQMQNPAPAPAPTGTNTNFSVNQTNWNNYGMRVIAYATAVNMPFSQAANILAGNVVNQISNTLVMQTAANQSNS